MTAMYVVLHRMLGRSLWIKVRKVEEEYVLPHPEVGERLLICNTLLSTTREFRPQRSGDWYDVITNNSRYLIEKTDGRCAQALIDCEDFEFAYESESGSLYFYSKPDCFGEHGSRSACFGCEVRHGCSANTE